MLSFTTGMNIVKARLHHQQVIWGEIKAQLETRQPTKRRSIASFHLYKS
jgi:hypothetical protein